MNPPGIITRQSPYTVRETMERFAQALIKGGITIYTRIDQQAEAARAGIHMAPLEFILFGNPQKGGSVMAVTPMASLDLPLKLVVWQDAAQKVWVSYNDYTYLRQRYALDDILARSLDLAALVNNVLGHEPATQA